MALGDGQAPEDGALAATAATVPPEDPSLAGTIASVPLPSAGDRDAAPGQETLRPFGPFTRVERLTEQGAMGVVARGYNAAFDRWELLKFIHPDLANQPEFVRQFFREGRVLAKLSHPNIVQVFAIYALDGRPCLSMEFLEGVSLAAHVAKARCPVAEWHELFLEAARGLAAAHDVGLLHRDIKPENLFVLVDRGATAREGTRLKLIDFGLATADRSHRTAERNDPTLVAAMSGGTPLYMAPELWRGEEASPRTDVYALGHAFYFALTGRSPLLGETVGEVRATVCGDAPFPDARELRPDLPAPLALVLARTIAKRKEDRVSSADELVATLVAAASAARPRRVPGSGPYRGFGSYSAAERDVFFGRDTEVAEVLEHLRTQSGVVLVGPGGSGKSSLAQAGVVPAIEDGALGGGIAYGSALLQPGAHPVQSLAVALAKRLGSPEKDVLAFLQATPARLGESLRTALPAEAGLVVVLDQLEELATLAPAAGEVRRFADAVSSLVEVGSAPIRVVATVRADLMDRLFAIEPLRSFLTRGFYPVRPMGPEALRQAMTGPALAASYRLEDPRMADSVLADVARTASGLPLLSFAMAAWWEARDETTRTLPSSAWQALGGLTGALTRHGDRVLGTMNEESRRVAEGLLLRLVSADRTRTRIARASLLDPAAAGPGAGQALDRLIAAKLVVESSGDLELAHDALITQWPTLRELLASSGEDRAFRERVAAAAREWDAQGRPDGALWTSDQAMRLARWFSATNAPLDQLELAFIVAVRRRATRSRVIARAAATGVVAVALAFGLVAKSNEREMARRLDATNASLRTTKAAYVQAETGRLNELAALEIQHDPGATLRHAAASFELEHDRALDVMVWNARALGLAIVLPGLGGAVTSVDVAPHTGRIAAAFPDGIELLDPASPDHAVLPARGVSTMAFSPSGTLLATGSSTGDVSIWPSAGVEKSGGGQCGGPVVELVWRDGDTVLAVCRAGGAVQILKVGVHDAAAGPAVPLRVPADATAIDVAPDGDAVLVGEATGAVVSVPVGEPKSAKPTALFRRPVAPIVVARMSSPSCAHRWSTGCEAASSATLAIDEGRRAEVRVDEVARSFTMEVATGAFAWIPARNSVALVGRSGELVVVSLTSLDEVARMPSPRHEVTSLAADSAGEWLIAGASDGTVQAFNMDQGAIAVTQASQDPAPSACGLSPDGASVACASPRGLTARVVERGTGVPRSPDRAALASVPDAVALGPEGRPVFTLASGELRRDGQGTPRLLTSSVLAVSRDRVAAAGVGADGHPALEVAPLAFDSPPAVSPLPAPVTALSWTARGTRLLVATADRKVRTLDVHPGGTTEAGSLDVTANDVVRAVAGSDDGLKVAVGTDSGDLFVSSAGGPLVRLVQLHGGVRCLDFAEAGRAIVVSAYRRVSVVDGDTGLAFLVATSKSPVEHCAQSLGGDRFTFVDADGTIWLKALDLSDVTASYIPVDPGVTPKLEGWKGLPVGLVR